MEDEPRHYTGGQTSGPIWEDDSAFGLTTNDLIRARDAFLGEQNNAYSVLIAMQDYGVFVEVGCKRFSFSTVDEAMKYVKMYLENPKETTKLFNDGKLFDEKKGNSGRK